MTSISVSVISLDCSTKAMAKLLFLLDSDCPKLPPRVHAPRSQRRAPCQAAQHPAPSHRAFFVRYRAEVNQGICLCSKESLPTGDDFIKCWVHECQRVFQAAPWATPGVFFPKQYTVRGSQCFKEWLPWCWMVWSGSRPACLPLPSFVSQCFSFVSQASFHLSPTSFHLSPSSFHLSPRLGACGRVPGWLVSHFLSFVSHFFSFVSQFFSFVSQAEWLWWGFRLACLPLPCICLPLLFICLPFPAGLSPTSFHLSPRLGACGRVPGRLVSHFLLFVSHFFSFVSQAGCLWSGSRLACLPLPCICVPFPFICLPLLFICPGGLSPTCLTCLPFPFNCLPVLFICLPRWMLVVGFLAGLSPTSFHLSPTSFHLSPSSFHLWVLVKLVSHFLSFVSRFFSLVCLPGWVLVVGFSAGLSPTSFQLSPTSFHLSPWVLVVGFPAGLSPTSFHLSPTSFHLSPASFHLFVSWSGSRRFPAGLSPTSFRFFSLVSQFF